MTLKLISLFAVFGSTIAGAAAAPLLKVVDRVQTAAASAAGLPTLFHEKDGSRTLVQLENIDDDAYNERLVAYGPGGKVLAAIKVARPPQGQFLRIDRVVRNSRGELVVITYAGDSSYNNGVLLADNLTTDSAALLGKGELPSYLDGIVYQGRDLALVSTDLGKGPNGSNPVLLRVVDLATGEVLVQALPNEGGSGRLGIDSHGQLKAVLFGYELFSLLDVSTGALTPLAPPRTQPSDYPEFRKLSIGELLVYDDGKSTRLLGLPSLLEGRLNAIRTYVSASVFVGHGAITQFVGEPVGDGLRVTNLESGIAQGPALPLNGQIHGSRELVDIVQTTEGIVALLSELKYPHSYRDDMILTYIDVQTGQVLRQSQKADTALTGQLLVSADGVLSLEASYAAPFEDAGYSLVDVRKNETLAAGTYRPVVAPIRAASGEWLGIRLTSDHRACAFDLLNPTLESCVVDGLLQSGPVEQFEVEDGRVVLPLRNSGASYDYSSAGYLELQVGE